jgi:hypothetical protein
MDNVIYLPGCNPRPSQKDLVEEATTVLLQTVMDVFVEYRVEPGSIGYWYDQIQCYLWATPIAHGKNGRLLERDVLVWRAFWRERALTRVGHLYPFC